ncbi:hypothetical protein [Kitasatospora griseola]|uniref:hypothetical protein n=1 Tax=Kitasatospora griseola TaxID=2064 RepID=UPI0016711F05|nr:hypothetical protein [Kitasatospora griseola]GGR00745.1 hypothetical protein GCM10010195_65690 [Kitasatospora griseola]
MLLRYLSRRQSTIAWVLLAVSFIASSWRTTPADDTVVTLKLIGGAAREGSETSLPDALCAAAYRFDLPLLAAGLLDAAS